MIAKQNIHKGNNFIGAFDYNDKKMSHEDPEKRAELLDHNFNKYNRELIAKEIQFLRQLRPNLTRDAYHVSLNFAQEDKLSKQDLIAIANDYMKGMGFSNNLYSLWQHHDADHCHAHLLIFRTRFDGSLVSDSNNFRRGEQLCRQLELKYNLQVVKSPKQAQERAPKKDELELFNRTGIPSNRMLMQVKVKMALENSGSLAEFIKNCQRENINLLFNQSETTGRVSGITYISSDGFIARGQALGNIFKWKNITDKLNYEQGRDNKTISEANNSTRSRFKDILNERDKSPEIRNGKTVRATGEHDGKSGRITSSNRTTEQKGNLSKLGDNPATTDRIKQPKQEDEEAVSNKFSTGASSVISGIGGLFGTTGAEEVDENAKRRKRKSRR